jgi:hypothetical protein
MAVTARQNNKQRRDGNPPPSNANRSVIMAVMKVVVGSPTHVINNDLLVHLTDAVPGEAGLPTLDNLTRATAVPWDHRKVSMDLARLNPHGHHSTELRTPWSVALLLHIVHKTPD